jgi:hypothetical protein
MGTEKIILFHASISCQRDASQGNDRTGDDNLTSRFFCKSSDLFLLSRCMGGLRDIRAKKFSPEGLRLVISEK